MKQPHKSKELKTPMAGKIDSARDARTQLAHAQKTLRGLPFNSPEAQTLRTECGRLTGLINAVDGATSRRTTTTGNYE